MPKNYLIRIIFYLIIVLQVIGCNNYSDDTPHTSIDSISSQKVDTTQFHPDADEIQIMKNASRQIVIDIKLSEQIMENSANPRVKGLADIIITDQTSAIQELSTLIKSQNINLSDSAVDVLNMEQFDSSSIPMEKNDKEYVKIIIKSLRKEINNLKNITDNPKTQLLQTWISRNLPRLEKNLDSARVINQDNLL